MQSLAEFVQSNREKAGYSVQGLADKINIAINVLEDIESGRELFLSVTQRQKLAKVFKCSIKDIKQYEREYQFDNIPIEVIDDLKTKILNHKTGLKCPICNEPLITRIARMYDIEDNLVLQPKAHCVKCVFQIKD